MSWAKVTIVGGTRPSAYVNLGLVMLVERFEGQTSTTIRFTKDHIITVNETPEQILEEFCCPST